MFRASLICALLLATAACGGDAVDDGETTPSPEETPTTTANDPDPASEEEAEGDGEEELVEEPEDDPAASEDDGSDASEAGGSVTIGDESWEFTPTMQCLVTDGDVFIAGTAANDPGVEITFDRFGEDAPPPFEPGDLNFSVTTSDGEWTAGGPADTGEFGEVTIEPPNVSGTVTVVGFPSGEEADASFEFSC